MLLPQCSRLMLLPWWLMLYPPMGDVADVIAMVAWWNGQRVTLILVQMLYVGPHPIYEADGICLIGKKITGQYPILSSLENPLKEQLLYNSPDTSLIITLLNHISQSIDLVTTLKWHYLKVKIDLITAIENQEIVSCPTRH